MKKILFAVLALMFFAPLIPPASAQVVVEVGTGIIIITTGIAGITIITGTVITDRYGPASSLQPTQIAQAERVGCLE